MKRLPFVFVAGFSVLFGAGCFDPLPQTVAPNRPTTPTPAPVVPAETENEPDLQATSLLGLQFPSAGLVALRDAATIKQEGALFYGQAYRLVPSMEQSGKLVGRVQILNLTDPYRRPRTALNDPMRLLLGCGGEDVNYGPACDFGPVATTTVNGLQVGKYDVTYYPQGNDGRGDDHFVTTTVWLVPVPKNSSAWLYVYASELESSTSAASLQEWVSGLTPLP